MLSDWYFCTAVQFPPQQTALHLEILGTLRDALAAEELVTDEVLAESITMLADAGPWRLLHALPLVLAAQHRRPRDEVTQAAMTCCTELLDTCVSTAGTRDQLYDLLHRSLTGAPAASLAAGVVDRAARLLGRPPASPPAAVPYLDLNEFAVPTLLLTILDALSRRDPASVREWYTGEERPLWITRAIEGEYGRQALLLAVATAARSGDHNAHEALEASGIGVADMEPDLMACYARARLRARGEGPTAQRQLLDDLEAATLGGLRPPQPDDGGMAAMRENVYGRLTGHVGAPRIGARQVITPVLWHLVLWEIAADHDPADCAARLARWWGPPPEWGEPPFDAEFPELTVIVPTQPGRAVRQQLEALVWLRAQQQEELIRSRERNARRRGSSRDQRAARPLRRPGAQAAGRGPRLTVSQGKATGTTPGAGAAICSPWTYRRSGQFRTAKVEPSDYGLLTMFPALREPIAMIRLGVASALAVRLLRARPGNTPPPRHLMALLLHAKDVLMDCRFRPFLDQLQHGKNPGPGAAFAYTGVPPHLHGLLLHVSRTLDHAGKGSYPQLDPATTAGFVLENGPGGPGPDRAQEQILFGEAALGIMTSWIREASAGHGRPARQEHGSARWFQESPQLDPPALRVLRAAVRAYQGRGVPPAAALFQELYPGMVDEFRDQMPDWDWLARRDDIQHRYASGRSRGPVLGANAVLCAPTYTVGQWRDVSPQIEQWLTTPPGQASDDTSHEVARTAMLATRLNALLREIPDDAAGPLDDWIQAFLGRINAMVSMQELPRGVRGRMIEWIPVPGQQNPPLYTSDPEQDRLAPVLTTVSDAITEFSRRAPRYVLLLLDRLRATSLPDGMANDLRHRLLRGVFQDRWRTDPRAGLAGPLGRVQARASELETDRDLSRFVVEMADRRLPHLEATLGDAFVALWYEVHRDPRIRPEALPLSTPQGGTSRRARGSRRWNLATSLDRYRDLEIVYPMPVDLDHADSAGETPDPVRSFFDDPRRRAGNATHALALGVVCGIERGASHGGDEVLFNCGLGTPLRVPVAAGTTIPLGELRAVRLSRPDAADQWTAYNMMKLRPAPPVAGERRLALVSARPEFPWLRVEIDGEDVYPGDDSPNAALIRAAWDPDLSRGFREAAQAPDKAAILACYEDELHGWLPVDRRLTELLSSPSEDDTVELTCAGRLADEEGRTRWRLVTRPGHSYVLSAADWADAAGIEEVLAHDPAGLCLHARIGSTAGLLTLTPGADGQLRDDRNRRWRQLFAGTGADVDHGAVRTGAGWVTTVEAPPGFPAEIPVDGLEPEAAEPHLFFEVDAWSEYEWRRGRVRGSALAARGLDDYMNPTRKRLAELRDIRRDQVFRLEGLIRLSPDGLSVVRGPGGLTLRAETSSLTLAPIATSDRVQVRGRQARVTSISNASRRGGQNPIPLPSDQLSEALARSAGVDPAELRELARYKKLNGAVVRRLRSPARALWGIWLEIGDRVWYCPVPESAFAVVPLWHGIGDRLTASQDARGWAFTAERRSIKVRARYDMATAADVPNWGKQTVGYEIDGDEVVQHPYRSDLACLRSDATVRGRFERSLPGLTVTPTGPPFRSRQEVTVTAPGDASRVLTGFTSAYDAENYLASVRSVRIRIDHISPGLVEVEREFVCDTRPRPRAIDPQQGEIDQFRNREALGGDLIVTGSIESKGLRVGSAARVPDGSYRRLMPRVEPDHQWIGLDEQDAYPTEQVRAVLVHEGQGYRASCRAAPPLSPLQFLGTLGGTVPRRDKPCQLPAKFRYIGTRDGEQGALVHAFEWGHGWTVEVADSRLNRLGPDGKKLALFHGDRITDATLRLDRGELVMGLRAVDVLPGLPHRLYDEAAVGVVHELNVTVDPGTGSVEVVSVLTGTQGADARSRSHHARHRPLAAHMTPASKHRLLEAVRSMPRAVRTHSIFARLDRDLFSRAGSGWGRRMDFIYIPAMASGGDADPGLREGDRVFLVSAGIRRSRDGNDVLMDFTPPTARDLGERRALKASVSRRLYSHRQDLLAKLFALQEAGHDAESQIMLVTLLKKPGREGDSWLGETRWSEPRPARRLPTMVEALGGSCLAVVVENSRRQLLLEIEPGVIFPAQSLALPLDAQAGSVVRLTLDGTSDPRAELAIPSDLSYVADDGPGRGAVILPKSPMLRAGAWGILDEDEDKRRTARHYTIGGLSGVEASAPSPLSRELLWRPHPKIAAVHRDGTRVGISPAGPELVAGRIRADCTAAAASLLPLRAGHPGNGGSRPVAAIDPAPEAAPIAVKWAQLSFADSGVAEITDSCSRRTFRYSDVSTGHWAVKQGEGAEPNGEAEVIPTSLKEPQSAGEIVFAAANGDTSTLRYPQGDLRRFGFPADHVLDIIRAATTRSERTFTVAGVAYGSQRGRGLWLELRPGHLSEVTGEMMRDDAGRSIARLYWDHFAPGDRVVLNATQAHPRSIPAIHLESWLPGPRGAFGLDDQQHRVLLPVASHSDLSGSLTLGAGRCRLAYPAGQATRKSFPPAATAWLDGHNELSAGTATPRRDDVVLLGMAAGRLIVHGLPGAHPELSPGGDGDWPDGWLRDALADQDQCEQLMRLTGGALAVTIEEAVPSPDSASRLVVSRRRQPTGKLEPDTLVWARFLGTFQGYADRMILLDAGGSLYAVPPDVLLPGVPSHLVEAAGVRDARVWIHSDAEGEIRGGRAATAEGRGKDIQVVTRRVLESPATGTAGLLCEEKETSGYRWLPAEQAGWSPAIRQRPAGPCAGPGVLGGPAPRPDHLPDRVHRTATCLRANATRQHRPGPLPGARRGGHADARLARIHLNEPIVQLADVDLSAISAGDSLLAEVSRLRAGEPPDVRLTSPGRRRIVVNLPIPIIGAMRSLARWNPVHDGRAEIPRS